MRNDLILWERELGHLRHRAAQLSGNRPWSWFETIAVLAVIAAGPVGWCIGLIL